MESGSPDVAAGYTEAIVAYCEEASPKDGTRQPLEPWSCIPADDAVGLTAGFQGVGKLDLGVARLSAGLRFRDFALFQRPIKPGNEKHVSQARLDRARARKEMIGVGAR